MGLDVLILALFAAVWSLFVTSWRHHLRIKARLNAPLSLPRESIEQIRRVLGNSEVILGTVTLFDLIYTATRRAPTLLSYFENLNVQPELKHLYDVLPPEALASVSFDSLDADVWTAVDGDAAVDMSIYSVDVAAAAMNGGGLDNSMLALISPDDIGGAADALNAFDFSDVVLHIPIYSIIVKGIRNIGKVAGGRLTGGEAFVQTGVEVFGSSAGGALGLVLGTHAAAALAPVTAGLSIILVPICALAGIFSGNTLSHKFKMWLHGDEYRRALREWEGARDKFNRYCTGLGQTFKREYPTIQRILHATHRSNLAGMRARWRKSSGFVKRYVYPSELSMGLRQVIRESKREFRTITIPYYEKLLMEVEGLGGVRAGTLVFNQGRPRLLGISGLERIYDEIPGAVREVERTAAVLEEEKRKLKEKL